MGTLTLTKIHHPFDKRDRDTLRHEYRGETLSAIRSLMPLEVAFAVSINGRVVADENMALVIPMPGDHIVFCPLLAGGNDGKMIGRVIGMIVVAALAYCTAQYELVPAFWGMSAGFVSAMAGAAIGIVGGVLVNFTLPPKN